MKKRLSNKIKYLFDLVMAKGQVAMILLLFAITAAIVGIISIIAFFVAEDGGLIYQAWSSLMYTLDAGNLAGVPTDNIGYLVLMSLATLCGLFFTSILIGILSAGVESRLNALRKGTSVVQEKGHTVIIGFDASTFTILRELVIAHSNKGKTCVVVLGEQEIEAMENELACRLPQTGFMKVVCRSGGLHERHSLERCAVENCSSVIVNTPDDETTIKVLLSLSAYLEDKELHNPDLRFIASLHDKQNIEVAEIASEGRAIIVHVNDFIARVIANTCRQHGLSQLLTELLNFQGNELYFERIPELVGKSFHEAMLRFPNAVAVGLSSDGQIRLNPPRDTVIGRKDELILLELDDGAFLLRAECEVDEGNISNTSSVPAKINSHLVVLGSNNKLPTILDELDERADLGTKITIVDDTWDGSNCGTYKNLDVSVRQESTTRALLEELLGNNVDNVLLLNDDSLDFEQSDTQTLFRLVLLRNAANRLGRHVSITTELYSVDNQRLAARARVDDFIIGSDYTNLIKAQYSENPKLKTAIDEMLDESGAEFYMKPAWQYVTLGQNIDGYTLTESAARKNEIYIGYRIGSDVIAVNPNKDNLVLFGEDDKIIVLAES